MIQTEGTSLEALKQERAGLQCQPSLFVLQLLPLEEENQGQCGWDVVRKEGCREGETDLCGEGGL